MYEESDGSLLVQSFLTLYLVMLGDFERLSFTRSDSGLDDGSWIWLENILVLLYFFLSTFTTSIVILNMLIAIMAKTFEHHNADLD